VRHRGCAWRVRVAATRPVARQSYCFALLRTAWDVALPQSGPHLTSYAQERQRCDHAARPDDANRPERVDHDRPLSGPLTRRKVGLGTGTGAAGRCMTCAGDITRCIVLRPAIGARRILWTSASRPPYAHLAPRHVMLRRHHMLFLWTFLSRRLGTLVSRAMDARVQGRPLCGACGRA
jgi:hypothetical protein